MFKIVLRDSSLEFSENLQEKFKGIDFSYIGKLVIDNVAEYLYYSSYEGIIFVVNSNENKKFYSYFNSLNQVPDFKQPTAKDSTILLDDSYCNTDILPYKLANIKAFIKYCSEHNNLKLLRFRSSCEPTKYIDIIKSIVDFSKNAFNINEFAIQSNFLFNDSVLKFLLHNFTVLHASFDVFPLIQHKHNALTISQYALIEKNLKALCCKARDVIIHCLVSKFSNDYLMAIVDYFLNLGIKVIFFEPMSINQKFTNSDRYTTPPDMCEFFDKLISTKLYALNKGAFVCSTLLPVDVNNKKLHYCGGVSCSMSFTPDGLISSCDEHVFHKIENLFMIGKIDSSNNNISLDLKKIQYLKKRTPLNMSSCKNCFLKFSCLGQCPYRTFCSTGNIFKVNCKSCALIKEYSKKYLLQLTKEILQKNKRSSI